MIGHIHGLHQPSRSDHSSSSNIIRIQARTASPIVINSVPKCSSQSARSHPIDTINGYNGYQQRGSHATHQQPMSHAQTGRGLKAIKDNQVLLIVQDDHVNGGGIPIMGRRLPTKSMDHHRQHYVLRDTAAFDEMPPLRVDPTPSHDIVRGRRSSRMLQQQQVPLEQAIQYQQQLGNIVEYKLPPMIPPTSKRSSSSRAGRKSARQQPEPAIDFDCPECSQTLTIDCYPNGNESLARSNSCQRIPLQFASSGCDCDESPVQMPSLNQSKMIKQQIMQLAAGYAGNKAQRPSRLSSHLNMCEANGAKQQHVRSSSCHDSRRRQQQQLLTTIAARAAHAPHQQQPQHRNVLPVVHPKPNLLNYTTPTSDSSHHQPQRYSSQAGGYCAKPAPTRGCHETGNQSRANADPQQQLNAVTQMYESLAAELKAKLGDPKTGPILLPPKDYDTMSRKQGKLSGIESRRSTNPQLVGPLNANQYATRQLATTDDEAKKISSSASFRSAAMRDHHEYDHEHSHLSRSNSSSGLGSISIGANSPLSSSSNSNDLQMNSSPSSSHDKINLTSSSSPTTTVDCNSSDSGHSSGHSANLLYRQNSMDSEQKQDEPRSGSKSANDLRGKGYQNHNPSKVSDGVLWNGRVEIPLKVNSNKNNGNTYLATKQIIY